MIYKAAVADDLIWDKKSIKGIQRFVWRIENLVKNVDYNNNHAFSFETLRLISEVTTCYENQTFNIAIGHLMKLSKMKETNSNFVETILLMLYPVAPRLCETLLEKLGVTIDDMKWPYIPTIKPDFIKCIVNVTNKIIFRLMIRNYVLCKSHMTNSTMNLNYLNL
jgi:leucyl-tRNA synthetase